MRDMENLVFAFAIRRSGPTKAKEILEVVDARLQALRIFLAQSFNV